MKVKQGQIIQLNNVIAQVYTQKMPFETSYKLYKLREAIKQQVEFNDEKTKEVVEEYDLKPNENGVVVFTDAKVEEQVRTKLQELSDLEVDIDWVPKDIAVNNDLNLSINDIEALKGFFNFTE